MMPDIDQLKDRVLGTYEERIQEPWIRNWMARAIQTYALVNDRWQTVFPNDVSDSDLPMVANLFRTNVEDVGNLFAEQIPNVQCFPDRSGFQNSKDAAETRERVLNGYLQGSRYWRMLRKHGQDMAAVGVTGIKVWPNFGRPSPQRFPTYRRIDPLSLLPEPRWVPELPSDNVIVHYTETLERLEDEYPAEMAPILESIRTKAAKAAAGMAMAGELRDVKGKPTEMKVLDFYTTEYIARVALWQQGVAKESALLQTAENPTGICPVQLAARPSWSVEPTGKMDGARGPMMAKNRFLRLFLQYFVDLVYGGKISWQIQNPYDRRPNAVYLALSPDAKLESVTPDQPSPWVQRILDILDNESRSSTMSPREREGNVQLNKATAAFLTAAQGQLESAVKGLDEEYASALEVANEFAFAADENWCNTKKTITGRARGRRFKTEYTPKTAIAGDYSNVVSYGAAAGLDKVSENAMLLMQQEKGNLSRRRVMEHSPFTDDVDAEMDEITRQDMEEAFRLRLKDPNTNPEFISWAMTEFDRAGATLWSVAKLAATDPNAPSPIMPQPGPSIGPGGPGGAPGPATSPAGLVAAMSPSGQPGAEAPGQAIPLGELRRLAGRR